MIKVKKEKTRDADHPELRWLRMQYACAQVGMVDPFPWITCIRRRGEQIPWDSTTSGHSPSGLTDALLFA